MNATIKPLFQKKLCLIINTQLDKYTENKNACH